MHVVQGDIVLPPDTKRLEPVEAVTVVEDVSRADAPAIIVGEQRQRLSGLAEGGTIPFSIEVPAESIDERHIYSVRVHIDFSGSGTVKKGDLVSTQSCPVLTRGHGTKVSVRVRPV